MIGRTDAHSFHAGANQGQISVSDINRIILKCIRSRKGIHYKNICLRLEYTQNNSFAELQFGSNKSNECMTDEVYELRNAGHSMTRNSVRSAECGLWKSQKLESIVIYVYVHICARLECARSVGNSIRSLSRTFVT